MGLYQLDRGNRFLPFDCLTTLVKGTDISTQGLNSLKVKRASLHRLSVDLLLLFARSVVSQDLWTATHPTLYGYKNGNVRTQMHRWRKAETAGKIPCHPFPIVYPCSPSSPWPSQSRYSSTSAPPSHLLELQRLPCECHARMPRWPPGISLKHFDCDEV